MQKIELLAPAGNKECFQAAVNNGADAIYIGGDHFSARAYADNFTYEEIDECIKYAHIRGVKVYVAINTNIYDDELSEAFEFIDFLYLNDVDGLIVSDFGLLNVLKQRYPSLRLHVSTQMNTHNLWQIKLLETLNVDRIILARETPLSTIKYIKQNTNTELEVFAHGALCVCYSGNCLHSSMIGKRSGNRGKCAQPCRMEYSLLENNKALSDKKYLLSTKDLNTLDNLGDLIDAGITSLKIEGRMKSKEYVALVVKTYRDAIDNYYLTNFNKVDYLAVENMKQVFSRGFTKGYLFNEKNADLSNTYRPTHLGTKIGKVIGLKGDKVQIKLADGVKQNDKIYIVQERLDDVNMYLSKIYVRDKLVPQGFKDETIEIVINSKVAKDSVVYKSVDNDLMNEISNTYLKNTKRTPIRMKFISNVGEPMALSIKDNNNHSVLVKSEYIVEEAINSPTSSIKIEEQLNRLASSAYTLSSVNVVSDNRGIIPVKYINELRREALEKMDELRSKVYRRSEEDIILSDDYVTEYKFESKKLKVKVHTIYQLESLVELMDDIDEVYYDDPWTYNLAKSKFPQVNLIPVLPRIMNDKSKFEINSPSYVINNYGDLLRHEQDRVKTDLYMNVTNKLTIASLCKLNVESITLSSELNKMQILDLIDDFNSTYGFIPPLEMVVYGRYQTMISKYCPIAKEHGFENKHCGACKNKKLALLDRMNYIFPITTDNDCNVTVYNSKTLHLIKYINEIYDMGITSIRLDFSVENPQEVYDVTKAYIDMIKYQDYELQINDVTYGYYLDVEKN